MFDSVLFEKAGVPSVPIITKPFGPTARALATLQRMPELPMVAVDHPITSLDHAELRERAKVAAPEIEAILLGRNSQ